MPNPEPSNPPVPRRKPGSSSTRDAGPWLAPGNVIEMTPLERHYRPWLLAIWLAAVAATVAVNYTAITQFRFWDPDDVMRLLEVRDWLAGQSWFDVAQHRMNLPTGLSMHWSRLLDVPLAAIMLLLEPFVGQRIAETVAAVTIPMLTLGATMGLIGGITRHRSGAGAGLLAAALCLLSIGTWYAIQPMRIDHHGYQIVCGLGIVWALVTRQERSGAVIAGFCAALWTHISLEGLAFTLFTSAWLGLLWIVNPEGRRQLPRFLTVLCVTSACLYLAVHGTRLIGATFCDQISPIHIGVFALAALLSFAAVTFASHSIGLRVTVLAATAVSCALLYRLSAPQCASGPFGSLGPLGHDLWYLNVPEGVPLWHSPVGTRLTWGVFPWVGLAGALTASLRSNSRRPDEWFYCASLATATGIGLLVTRAGAFANLLALPGAVGLIVVAFEKSETWYSPLRILARAGSILLLNPFAAQSTALLAAPLSPSLQAGPAQQVDAEHPHCGQIDSLAALDRLPPTTIMAALELGPNILAGTHHFAVTGPYHRNPDALEDVLRFFTADERTAHSVAMRRNAHLLAFCPADRAMAGMRKLAPDGVAAALLQGRPPAWLQPAPLPSVGGLKVYRIKPITDR